MLVNESRFPIKEILLTGWLPSSLKVAYYRLRGAEIGEGVKIGFGTVILGQKIKIGERSKIGFATIIRGREIEIGSHTFIGSTTFLDVEKIYIGDDAKINEQVFAGGPMFSDSYLHIGSRTTVMQHTFLNPSKPLVIKDGAGIGGRCSIFTHSSWQNMFEGYPVKFAPVIIGENAWIPWDVFIMPGVTVGNGATVGAGSLVIKDIPERALAAGVPAKIIRNSEEYLSVPSFENQLIMLGEIVKEFCSYLEYHNFVVTKESPHEHFTVRIRITDRTGNHLGTIVFQDVAGQYSLSNENDALIVSLAKLSANDRVTLNNREIVWVDIPSVERSPYSNDLAEEFIEFLKRYGLHLKRESVRRSYDRQN